MPNRVVLLDANQLGRWDEFVEKHPLGSIYHTSSWRQVVECTYSLKPFYFTLRDENGEIRAGLPLFEIRSFMSRNRLSTLPCAQSCDPLVSSEEQYLELKKAALGFAGERNLNSWELKTSSLFAFENQAAQASIAEYFTYVLDIEKPIDILFSTFHKGQIQRSINKAYRSGLSLKRCDSIEDVRYFHHLYLQMRRQKGLLPQPRYFFENLWNFMHKQNRIDILFADYRGRMISGIMLLKYGDRVIYEYGATLPGYHRFSPSPYLLWEAIQRSKAEGYRLFDFGRTASSEENLALFKKRWGASLHPFFYYELINGSGSSSLRRSQKMKTLMRIAMRALPDSICDYAGRILYKYLL
jgi:serine/alanine adding enzyme